MQAMETYENVCIWLGVISIVYLGCIKKKQNTSIPYFMVIKNIKYFFMCLPCTVALSFWVGTVVFFLLNFMTGMNSIIGTYLVLISAVKLRGSAVLIVGSQQFW